MFVSITNDEFTTPIDGNYEFSFSAHVDSSDSASIQVRKNGDEVQSFTTGDDSYYNHLSSTWIIELKAGDRIRLYFSGGQLWTNYDKYKTFSGKLLEII